MVLSILMLLTMFISFAQSQQDSWSRFKDFQKNSNKKQYTLILCSI